MKAKNNWKKVLVVITIIVAIIFGAGYLGLQYLRSVLLTKITGCEIENKNFQSVINFEYVNNWIIVKVKVGGSDKEYPFIFDTGAQTVIMDSLLNEISKDNFQKFTSGNKSDSMQGAFDGGLISLNNLAIGDVKFRDIGAITAKNSEWGMLNCISAFGIIGYNIIQTCSFQIDYENKQIIITDNLENLSNYKEIQWIKYQSSEYQETPIIPAVIDDSIKINLLFDIGWSGGINLFSSSLYQSISRQFPDRTAKFSSTASIRIKGEKYELKNSIIYRTSTFSFGNNISENMNITISDVSEEREFTGNIGNKYFENFILTLDYRNKKVGFIPKQKIINNTNTFGINYLPFNNNIKVTVIYDEYEPKAAGIQPGDEIYSINGIKISDLQPDKFCEIYRNEYSFQDAQDSLLHLAVLKDGSITEYQFKKQNLFDNVEIK